MEREEIKWKRKATDREQWEALIEGYVLQWMTKTQSLGQR